MPSGLLLKRFEIKGDWKQKPLAEKKPDKKKVEFVGEGKKMGGNEYFLKVAEAVESQVDIEEEENDEESEEMEVVRERPSLSLFESIFN